MFHERMLYNSPYVTEPIGLTHGHMDAGVVFSIAQEHGRLKDSSVRELVGEARMLELVTREMSSYVSESIRAGRLNDQAAALVRLFKGIAQNRIVTLAFEAAGPEGAAWTEDMAASLTSTNFLMRQGGTIGGGTTEMARNVISERVLSMPASAGWIRTFPSATCPVAAPKVLSRQPGHLARRRVPRRFHSWPLQR